MPPVAEPMILRTGAYSGPVIFEVMLLGSLLVDGATHERTASAMMTQIKTWSAVIRMLTGV